MEILHRLLSVLQNNVTDLNDVMFIFPFICDSATKEFPKQYFKVHLWCEVTLLFKG